MPDILGKHSFEIICISFSFVYTGMKVEIEETTDTVTGEAILGSIQDVGQETDQQKGLGTRDHPKGQGDHQRDQEDRQTGPKEDLVLQINIPDITDQEQTQSVIDTGQDLQKINHAKDLEVGQEIEIQNTDQETS